MMNISLSSPFKRCYIWMNLLIFSGFFLSQGDNRKSTSYYISLRLLRRSRQYILKLESFAIKLLINLFWLEKMILLLGIIHPLVHWWNPLIHWWIEHKLEKNNSFLGVFLLPVYKTSIILWHLCPARNKFHDYIPCAQLQEEDTVISVWTPGYMRGNGGSEAEKKRTLSCYRHEGPPEEQPSCSPSNWSCCFGVAPVAPVWQIANPKIDLAASAGKNIVFCPKLGGGIRKTEAFSTENRHFPQKRGIFHRNSLNWAWCESNFQ